MKIKAKENNEELKELIKNNEFDIKVNYDKSNINKPSKIKYEYDENTNLNIKEFTLMTEEWLDFIIDCRNGKCHNPKRNNE